MNGKSKQPLENARSGLSLGISYTPVELYPEFTKSNKPKQRTSHIPPRQLSADQIWQSEDSRLIQSNDGEGPILMSQEPRYNFFHDATTNSSAAAAAAAVGGGRGFSSAFDNLQSNQSVASSSNSTLESGFGSSSSSINQAGLLPSVSGSAAAFKDFTHDSLDESNSIRL